MRLVRAGLVNDKRYGKIRILEFKPDTLTVTLRKGHAPEIELRGGPPKIKRPPQPHKLLRNEEWLRTFTTSEQRKAILTWLVENPTKRPTEIEIRETQERANRIILNLERDTAEF